MVSNERMLEILRWECERFYEHEAFTLEQAVAFCEGYMQARGWEFFPEVDLYKAWKYFIGE